MVCGGPEEEWSFTRWRKESKADFMPMIRGFMSYYGRATPDEAEANWLASQAVSELEGERSK